MCFFREGVVHASRAEFPKQGAQEEIRVIKF